MIKTHLPNMTYLPFHQRFPHPSPSPQSLRPGAPHQRQAVTARSAAMRIFAWLCVRLDLKAERVFSIETVETDETNIFDNCGMLVWRSKDQARLSQSQSFFLVVSWAELFMAVLRSNKDQVLVAVGDILDIQDIHIHLIDIRGYPLKICTFTFSS